MDYLLSTGLRRLLKGSDAVVVVSRGSTAVIRLDHNLINNSRIDTSQESNCGGRYHTAFTYATPTYSLGPYCQQRCTAPRVAAAGAMSHGSRRDEAKRTHQGHSLAAVD